MLPIVHAEADYRLPMRYGDRLEAVMTVSRIGAGSYTLRCRFEMPDGGVAAEVRTVHAALSPGAGPCPLPATLGGALAGYSAADASISA